jgi:tetraacyldisaccharide 4'-kinase
MLNLTKPKIWGKNAGFMASLLLPFAVPYFLLLRLRSAFVKTEILPAKIICVGNVVVGGAGKTPTCIKIAEMLMSLRSDAKIAFISKGYKGLVTSPTQVILGQHDAKQVGDEPLLLAQYAPCFVGKNRLEVCKKAISEGYEILILDDGLHDRRIKKDLSIMVVDGGYGFGNAMLMPAGPLRDRIDFAAKGVGVALMVGRDERNAKELINSKIKPAPEIIVADFESFAKPVSEKYFAFAGIGRPEKFYKTLENKKFNVVGTKSFPDHHYYSEQDERALQKLAEAKGAKLITTEKDAIKLSTDFKANVEVLKVSITLSERNIKDRLKALI